MPSRERQAASALAQALREAGLPEMAGRAEALHYSDFSSSLPGPKLALVDELRGHGKEALAQRVIRGEFDG